MDSFIEDYVKALVECYPEISSIWVIGSRANNTATDESDWDLMVFANSAIFKSLQTDDKFNSPNVDLLIVYNGDDFKSPWNDASKRGCKGGSLKGWSWKEISAVEATYQSGKWKEASVQSPDDKLPHFDSFNHQQLTAKKIWPK